MNAIEPLNDVYEKWMGWPLLRAYYEESGFFNVGFWADGVETQPDACRRLVEELLKPQPNPSGDLLDVACGEGGNAQYLLGRCPGLNVTCVNICPRQLDETKRRAPRAALLLQDAAALDLGDVRFDTVLCVEAAFHFRSRRRFLERAYEVLKPGGWLLYSDMTYRHQGGLEDLLVPEENRLGGLPEYEALLAQTPFSDVQMVDARAACWGAYCDRLLEWARRQHAAGQASDQDLRLVEESIISLPVTHYLIVSARKP